MLCNVDKCMPWLWMLDLRESQPNYTLHTWHLELMLPCVHPACPWNKDKMVFEMTPNWILLSHFYFHLLGMFKLNCSVWFNSLNLQPKKTNKPQQRLLKRIFPLRCVSLKMFMFTIELKVIAADPAALSAALIQIPVESKKKKSQTKRKTFVCFTFCLRVNTEEHTSF